MFRTKLLTIFASMASICIVGCSTHRVTQYSSLKPTFNPKQFFNGNLVAHGIVQNRSREITQSFTADLIGTWNGNEGTLDEKFTYKNGSNSQRIWKLTIPEDGILMGTAGDVNGTAYGEYKGNALKFDYNLTIPIDGTTYKINVEDWMYLVDNKTLVARSYLSKVGINLGEVTIIIRRVK